MSSREFLFAMNALVVVQFTGLDGRFEGKMLAVSMRSDMATGSDATVTQNAILHSFKRTRCQASWVASLLPVVATGSFEGDVSVKVSRSVWKKTQRKGNALLVLLCLADHADDDGICWPSESTIARDCRCSLTAVKVAIKLLLEKKDVVHLQKGGTFKGGKWTHSKYQLKRYSSSAESTPQEQPSGAENESVAVQNPASNHQGSEEPSEEKNSFVGNCMGCGIEVVNKFRCDDCREKGVLQSFKSQ